MPVTIAGATTNVLAEVEAGTRAVRIVNRSPDYGTLGSYAMALNSGIMAAGIAGAAPIFSFRFAPTILTTSLCLVKRVEINVNSGITGFAAGVANFNMFALRNFTVNQAGGTAATLTVNNGKLRTSMGTTGVADFRISSTAALTGSSYTADAQQLAQITAGVPTTATFQLIAPNSQLWREEVGEQPLVLATSEGFGIQATVPATGTWNFGVSVTWDEVATY